MDGPVRKGGFSIIELVIAVSLASFVLVAVAALAAQMARNQVEGIRSGTVTGWSIISYGTMVKEIEEANVLAYPIADAADADSIVICKNWSRGTGTAPAGGKLDAAAVVSVIQYCMDPTAPVAPNTGYTLRRYANVGAAVTCPCSGALCSATLPEACNSTGPGWLENGVAGSGNSVVGFRLEKNAGLNIFRRDNSIGGVRVRYVIGAQTATANVPTPKFTTFDFGIGMQKQFSSTVD